MSQSVGVGCCQKAHSSRSCCELALLKKSRVQNLPNPTPQNLVPGKRGRWHALHVPLFTTRIAFPPSRHSETHAATKKCFHKFQCNSFISATAMCKKDQSA
eukprot:2294303-Amphidinium_carterae.2